MISMWNLFSRQDYETAVEAGLIRVQKHPELPLWINNYTDAAMYTKGSWDNPAIRICRGLITDIDDRIVARPFEKFFNHNQPEAGRPSLSLNATVLDKVDGSLGILYQTGKQVITAGLFVPEYAIATRGSFTSEQAIHATKVWQEKYADRWTPDPGWTYLFEIVYPENRIVLDYGDMDDLVFLGAHLIKADGLNFCPGKSAPGSTWWPGPMVESLSYRSLGKALEAPPRDNAEGMVVILPNKMVKIKQEDYLILHKLMTGLRPRSIWEFLAVNACKDLIEKPKHWGSRIGLDPARAQEILDIGPDWKSTYLEGVPDEFLQWVEDTIESIEFEVFDLGRFLRAEAQHHKEVSPDRKTYFQNLKNDEHFGILGLLYDDKDITTALWKAVYPPAAGKPFVEQLEEAA